MLGKTACLQKIVLTSGATEIRLTGGRKGPRTQRNGRDSELGPSIPGLRLESVEAKTEPYVP